MDHQEALRKAQEILGKRAWVALFATNDDLIFSIGLDDQRKVKGIGKSWEAAFEDMLDRGCNRG